MNKYIDAERLRVEIESLEENARKIRVAKESTTNEKIGADGQVNLCQKLYLLIDSLQQEQQMPDSTQLIAEWEKEKAVLEQKDFRGDAERMAYNAFLDGFVKGLGYEGTR